jgi:hypothetical protein
MFYHPAQSVLTIYGQETFGHDGTLDGHHTDAKR